ncbi:metallophosphoesterase [Antrihabitans cavernicola]|nr:metallophosphoesterase [Spelaeibacter cavernicola]
MAATAFLPMMGAARATPARAQSEPMIASDLEVVTVTATSVIVTWTTVSPTRVDQVGRPFPLDADTELRLAPADGTGPPKQVFHDATPTPFHYAEVHGLEPGRPYRFEAYSDGVRAVTSGSATSGPNTPETTGRITVLVPPPGRHLRTIALSNDVHYGEQVSGLVVGGLPPGYSQDPGLPPYPEVMLTAMLDDLRKDDRRADHLVVAGDLTSEASQADSQTVRSSLDSWGTLGTDYFVSRGNHDRPHVGADYAQCRPVPQALDHHDCWGESFVERQRLLAYELGGLRLLGLDTTEMDGSGGSIEPDQMAAIRAELQRDTDRPTLVFGHHPVTFESAITNLSGPGFVLNRGDSSELQKLYVDAPGVFFHHSGHTHRNKRTKSDTSAAVEFLEIGAVKEYPGGYTLLSIYEGGYMVNFYKTRSDLARRWSTRSRGEFFGLFPEYAFGSLEDRNHVVARDFSGLLPA